MASGAKAPFRTPTLTAGLKPRPSGLASCAHAQKADPSLRPAPARMRRERKSAGLRSGRHAVPCSDGQGFFRRLALVALRLVGDFFFFFFLVGAVELLSAASSAAPSGVPRPVQASQPGPAE